MKNKKNIEWLKKHGFKALLGLFVVTALTVTVAATPGSATSSEAEQCVRGELACTEKSDVPREWRWKKTDVKFDHMYRSATS